MNPVVLSGPNSRAVTFPVASLFRYRLPPSVYQNAADAGRQRDSQHPEQQCRNTGGRESCRMEQASSRGNGLPVGSPLPSHASHQARASPLDVSHDLLPASPPVFSFFNSAFLGLHSRTTCTKRYPEVGGFSSSIWIMPVTAVVQKCGVGMHSVAARGRRYFVNGCNIREKGFASGFRCLSAGFRTPVGQQTINRGSVALHG